MTRSYFSPTAVVDGKVAKSRLFQLPLAAALFGLTLQTTSQADQVEVSRQQEIEHLRARIIAVQLEAQRKLESLQQQTDTQIEALQAQINQMSAQTTDVVIERTAEHSASNKAPERLSKFEFSGDFRLRYEYNSSFGRIDASDRGVLRGRLDSRYLLDDSWSLGARVVTGDADNPRTTDVTIGDFAADLEISVDQAYVNFKRDDLFLTGGKFAKPFLSTELVWDGDVNPQGLGGRYFFPVKNGYSLSAAGIWFLIDEPTLAESSDMAGGQLTLGWQPAEEWQLSVSGAYFDYELSNLSATGMLSPRGNRLTPDGLSYVSDFNLFDVMAVAEYSGYGVNWPVRLVADYVQNFGANVQGDQAWGADLFVGRLNQPGHFLFRYGYAHVETDAVLGLYSNDNIPLATNYELHTLSVDYRLSDHVFIGLTEYVYRWLDPFSGNEQLNNDWGSRTRLNLYFQF